MQGAPVELLVKTGYPFDGLVTVRVGAGGAWAMGGRPAGTRLGYDGTGTVVTGPQGRPPA